MSSFGRAFRLALGYRWTVAGTVLSAIGVALLWGGNISSVYPLVQAVFRKQSLPQWIDASIRDSSRNVADFRTQEAGLARQLAAAPADRRKSLESELASVRLQLRAEQAAEAGYRRAKPWIDRWLPHDCFQTLVLILAALLVGTLLKDACQMAGAMLAERLGQLVAFDIRRDFYHRTLRMDLAAFGDKGASELLSRFTNDMDAVAGGITIVFGRAIREPFKAIACLAGAAFVCWRLLVLSLVVAPLAAFLIHRLSRSLKRANRRALESMTSLYNLLGETFSGMKIIKAFTMERRQRRAFFEISKRYYRKSMRIAFYDALVSPLTEIMGILTICLALLSGAYLVLNEQTHLLGIKMSDRPLVFGELILFYGLLAGVSDPARKISEVFNRLQRASAACDRVYDLLDREPTVCDPPRPHKLARHARDLTFQNVHFGYTPEQLVLDNVSLRIAFGETLAIVGPNGCGKSTLASLVPRFFDPQSGIVTLDGVDVREVRLRELRSQIGLVAQEALLFNDTVLSNILDGNPRATREQAIEAAQKAHAHRFIEQKLEEGYETVVGPLGGRLSGGQRQRVALARAILRDPAILILDEATSQIDVESEQLIHKALEQFARDRTAIIITHRLSTLELADRIAVMHAGRIIDVGTHAELSSRCELFRKLYEVQFRETA